MSEAPAGGRFVKGRSGNPKGRPRKIKQPPSSAFDIVTDRTLTIVQGGVSREMTVDEALQHRTYQDAVAGSRAARREVLKMIDRREKALAARMPQAKPIKMLIEHAETGNANRALEILGIAAADTARNAEDPQRHHMLLEPWAVASALQRRRLPLSERDIDNVRRLTRDAKTIAALRSSTS